MTRNTMTAAPNADVLLRITGQAWVYGDHIDTDVLAPAAYLRGPLEHLLPHCLEALDPDFAQQVKPGDIFVAGENLGIGSSREQAPQALLALGVRAVVAKSFGRIFYRNAVNLGLPALLCPQADRIHRGMELRVEPQAGRIVLPDGALLTTEVLPEHLLAILRDGGLIPHLRKRRQT